MKKLLLLVSIVLLASCERPSEKNFKDIEPNTDYEVRHIFLDDFKAVDEEYDRIYQLDKNLDKIEYETGERLGFSYFMGDVCYIVMAKASKYTLRDFERTLGHEHTHCLFGSWHN